MAKISAGFRTSLMALGGLTATVMVFIYASTIYTTKFGILGTWDAIIAWPAVMSLHHTPYLFPDKSCFPCSPPTSLFVASSIAGNLVIFMVGAWLTGQTLNILKIHAPTIDPPRHLLLRWILSICASLGVIGFLGICFADKYYPYTKQYDSLACVFGQILGVSSMLFMLICLTWVMCYVGATARTYLTNKSQ